jgi:exodeoxyribonuclease V alpha subunit
VARERRVKPRAARTDPEAPAGEREDLNGTVEAISFRAEDTGYTVCRVAIPGRSDTATVVGNCAAIWIGETLRAEGRWTRHHQHGLQFQAETIACIAPTSEKGIERYLASGMIRGIGKVMAQRLVAKFGADTLRVIEKESARLEEVDGIGPTRRKMIKDSWIEQKAVRDIMIFLQGHGVGTAQSARIYRAYGGQAIALISENPYRLCRDVWGIGFQTADKVAMSVGVPKESPLRAQSGLIHVLQTMTDEGHCYANAVELTLQAQALLDIPAEILQSALESEISRGALVREASRVYLPHLFKAECEVAESLRRLRETPIAFKPIIVDKALPWAEARMKIAFAPMQADALRTALSEKVAIITGGPGVGKTTIIRALVDVYSARSLAVILAAPTGRAAKRMDEATGHEAKTIHRLLEVQPHGGGFARNADNPLEGDVFILDEVSMVDLPLMHAFLNALPDPATLILVGDTDQLPSVGPGNVLRDLIESGTIPCKTLTTIFRQQEGSLIIRNAHHVNDGEALELPERNDRSDFFFVECLSPEDVIHRMKEIVTSRIPKRFGFDPMDDIQVLTPMRRNALGSENLNLVLQEALNPPGPPEIRRYGRPYRKGDRLMQIRNNYDKGVFNGDIGRLIKVDTEEQQVVVDFDGVAVPYELSELDELAHAYACSIHKSQGSEYPAVVILLTTQHYRLLQRNLLYTAITRGRKLVCLIGSQKAVGIAIRNNEIRLRRTTLRQRLTGDFRVDPDWQEPA